MSHSPIFPDEKSFNEFAQVANQIYSEHKNEILELARSFRQSKTATTKTPTNQP